MNNGNDMDNWKKIATFLEAYALKEAFMYQRYQSLIVMYSICFCAANLALKEKASKSVFNKMVTPAADLLVDVQLTSDRYSTEHGGCPIFMGRSMKAWSPT